MELRKDRKAERLEYLGSRMDFWQNWKDVGWWLAGRQTSSPRLEDNNIIYINKYRKNIRQRSSRHWTERSEGSGDRERGVRRCLAGERAKRTGATHQDTNQTHPILKKIGEARKDCNHKHVYIKYILYKISLNRSNLVKGNLFA